MLTCLCFLPAGVLTKMVADAVAQESCCHLRNHFSYVKNLVFKLVSTEALFEHENCFSKNFYLPEHHSRDRQHRTLFSEA